MSRRDMLVLPARATQMVSESRPPGSGGERWESCPYDPESSSSSGGGLTGVETTYFPEAQLPRSITRHRSLQKGNSGALVLTGFLQIGQLISDKLIGRGSVPPA